MMLYSIHTWDLVQALVSASPASCKTPATSIDSICPNNHLRRNKNSWKKIKLPTNCIVLPWPTYTEPSPKRGSDKINRLRARRTQQQQSRIIQPGLTNRNPALGEVDLEPSAKRGTDRTKALVSLYFTDWLKACFCVLSFDHLLDKTIVTDK